MSELSPVRTGDPVQDNTRLRQLYGRYPTGVAALCGLRDGEPVGIVATSFTPVSVDPAIVSVCIQHTSTTWPRLSQGDLGVSVLASSHEAASRQIAAKTGDRFAGISWFSSASNSVFLEGAAAWLDCAIHNVVTAGDHDVVLLEVTGFAVDHEASPLVFHDSHFRTLVASDQ
ncbi:flavin reductase family protein [Tsukamurella tyrosinosolvens]|uniref:flavin reductase family protein n=1 Tax=Tsukamurella tyrosinosolvens TaxID=57704 RepID=UPI000C7F54A0|nr:flavin reductase family protein [Tsukamurella tyrosinosolvens]AUN41815.1 oxidoreductase [Tsukamurella tyrosinosolvens]